MVIVPMELPRGLYKNGTRYQARNRWFDASLVRWHDGSIRPVGGWVRRTDSSGDDIDALVADAATETVRDCFAWRSLNQSANVVFGSNSKLYHLSEGGAVTDITPALSTSGDDDSAIAVGYGSGPYGAGAYGAANNTSGSSIVPPQRWALDNFGQVLVALQIDTGNVYEHTPGGGIATPILSAPEDNADLVVTDESILMLIAAGGDPRRVEWSDQGDLDTWTAGTDNYAGGYTLPGSGRLLRGVKVREEILVLGEDDAFTAQFVDAPFIYRFDRVGTNVGMIAAHMVAVTDDFAVWLGRRNFYIYDGTVRILPCEVIDYLFDDANVTKWGKATAVVNPDFNEIWFMYQSKTAATNEVDSYIAFDYVDQTWNVGRLQRQAAVGPGVLSSPLMVDEDGYIYNHEQKGQRPTGDVYIETGPIELNNGGQLVVVDRIFTDGNAVGDVNYTLYGSAFPLAAEYSEGPYTQYAGGTPVKIQGRQIRMRADFLQAEAELGLQRLSITSGGDR